MTANSYCQAARAVVDGRVESIAGDAAAGFTLTVRIDAIAAGDATSLGIKVGESFLIGSSGFYPDGPKVGDRVLVPVEGPGRFGWRQFRVDAASDTRCDGTMVSADVASELLVKTAQECSDSLDARGLAPPPCNDTVNCALRAEPSSDADSSLALLLVLSAVFGWRRRRRH